MERLRCLAKADCVADCVWLGHTTVCRMAAHRKSDRRRDDLCAVELRKTYCELVISAASGLAASPYRLTRVVLKCDVERLEGSLRERGRQALLL